MHSDFVLLAFSQSRRKERRMGQTGIAQSASQLELLCTGVALAQCGPQPRTTQCLPSTSTTWRRRMSNPGARFCSQGDRERTLRSVGERSSRCMSRVAASDAISPWLVSLSSFIRYPNVYSTASRFSRVRVALAWLLDPPSINLGSGRDAAPRVGRGSSDFARGVRERSAKEL